MPWWLLLGKCCIHLYLHVHVALLLLGKNNGANKKICTGTLPIVSSRFVLTTFTPTHAELRSEERQSEAGEQSVSEQAVAQRLDVCLHNLMHKFKGEGEKAF